MIERLKKSISDNYGPETAGRFEINIMQGFATLKEKGSVAMVRFNDYKTTRDYSYCLFMNEIQTGALCFCEEK